MNGEKYKGELKNNKKGKWQETESDGDRGGGRSTYCVSYLCLSVLADRIEVFSIYANHSHRHRIITARCQESSPSAQSLHPLLWQYLALYLSTHHPEIPLSLSPLSWSVQSSLLSTSPCFIDEPSLWKTRCSARRTRQREFYIRRALSHAVIGSMQANNRWLVIMGGELRKSTQQEFIKHEYIRAWRGIGSEVEAEWESCWL